MPFVAHVLKESTTPESCASHWAWYNGKEKKKVIVKNLPESLKLISQKSRQSEEEVSQEEESEKNQSNKEKSFQKAKKKKTKKVNRKVMLEEKSIISSKKSKSK